MESFKNLWEWNTRYNNFLKEEKQHLIHYNEDFHELWMELAHLIVF